MFQDLRYGARMLLKRPSFTLIAVITLALGIGANAAIFSLINKVLLRPLPVAQPGRIVAINNTTVAATKERTFPTLFSYLNYRDLRDRNEILDGLIAYTMAPVSLSHAGFNERVWGYLVSGNYFDTMGAKAVLGRMISPEDDRAPGAHPVAVLSHKCFERRFGADPSVVGRELTVNGRSFTVIGVAPPGFIGLEVNYVPEIWFPLMMQSEIRPGREWLNNRKRESLFLAGRLKPGITAAQAESSLKIIAAALAREYPNENEGMSIELSPPGLFGALGRGPILGFSTIGIFGVMSYTVSQRTREIGLRMALGAQTGEVVKLMLLQGMKLAALGAGIGLLISLALTRLVKNLLFGVSPTDPLTFGTIVLLLMSVALLACYFPARKAIKVDPIVALRQE
jgi:MacB-like periplasmic core domain/FtsX-like permease family